MNKIKIVVATLLLLSVSAVAEGAGVDDLIARGAELRKAGQHGEALQLFERAHARAPSGRTLAQMGLAEFSLQRYVDAEAHLAAALATDTPWITKNRRPLVQALQSVRTHTALVAVVGTAGADVTMNGKPIGRLPLSGPLRVSPAKLHFEATAAGRQAATFDISASEGTLSQVTLDLPPLVPPPPLPPPPLPPLSPSVSPPPVLVAAPALRKSTVGTSGPNWSRWSGIGLLALSAAAITTGIVWLVSDNNGTCNLPAQSSPEARCMRVYDTRVSGWIAIGGGVAGAAGGGVLLWQSNRATDLRLDVAAASLAVSGKF